MTNKEYKKIWYLENKAKTIERAKAWKKENRDKVNEGKKIYYKINKEEIMFKRNIYRNEKKLTDPLFKLHDNIRASIGGCIRRKGFKKIHRTHEILCCSIYEFKTYIESKWENWMCWDNYGKYNGEKNFGWDLDHIIPSSTAITEGDVIRLNHFTNFQPLCSKINRDIKKNKIY